MDYSYGAVVYRQIDSNYHFLIVQHTSDDHWDLPKGHPDEPETPQETALREVLEETNYHIKLIEGFSKPIQYRLPQGEEKIVTFFLGEAIAKGDRVVNKEEIKQVKWLSYEEAINIMTYDNSRQVLRIARDYLHSFKNQEIS
jgi:bis(5'-nucleosidyl)-tetraphosphatase